MEQVEEGQYVYGCNTNITKTLIMAGGGSHWWNYVVHFNEDGEQVSCYIENKDGITDTFKTLYYRHTDEGLEYVKLFYNEIDALNESSEWFELHNY